MKDPDLYSRLDMISRRLKFAKMLKRRTASCGENPKICGPQMQNTRKLIKCIGGISNGLSPWGKYQGLGVHTWKIASVRQSVETRVVGMSRTSCMTRNISYKVAYIV